jgi:outer membrane protein OmpA-like peptidoglycan-associated protein
MRRTVFFAALLLAGCHAPGPEHFVVFYAPQSSALDPQGVQIVATVAERARQRPGTPVVVRGYADADIGVTDARLLAAKRSRAVADALVADGVDPARVARHGMGGVDFSMDSIETRRVEISLGEN